MMKQSNFNLKSLPPKVQVRGLTLIELLIVVSILAIISSISVVALRSFWQGQVLRANLDIVRNWLEATRRAALRGEACTITFNNGTRADMATIISSTPSSSGFIASCNQPNTLQLESPGNGRTYNFLASTGGSALSQFTFTPRGTLFNTNATPSFSSDIIISLQITSSTGTAQSTKYCLRLSPLMANITQPSSVNCT